MVVDGDGRYVGVLSEGDVLYALMPDFEGLMESGASLQDAVAIFLANGGEYADQPIRRLVIRKSITVGPEDELGADRLTATLLAIPDVARGDCARFAQTFELASARLSSVPDQLRADQLSGQGDRAGVIGGRPTWASRGESVATATDAPYFAAAGSTG
jgi:hypothetical protein